jgi:hypothetical protein
MYVHVHACMHVCMHACMHTYMHVCVKQSVADCNATELWPVSDCFGQTFFLRIFFYVIWAICWAVRMLALMAVLALNRCKVNSRAFFGLKLSISVFDTDQQHIIPVRPVFAALGPITAPQTHSISSGSACMHNIRPLHVCHRTCAELSLTWLVYMSIKLLIDEFTAAGWLMFNRLLIHVQCTYNHKWSNQQHVLWWSGSLGHTHVWSKGKTNRWVGVDKTENK